MSAGGFAAPSLLAIPIPFRPCARPVDVWHMAVFGAHKRGRAVARPVTVKFAARSPIHDPRNDAGRLLFDAPARSRGEVPQQGCRLSSRTRRGQLFAASPAADFAG